MRRLVRLLLAFVMRAFAIAVLLGILAAGTFYASSMALPEMQSPSQIAELLRARIDGARERSAHLTSQSGLPFAVDEALFASPAGKALLSVTRCAEVERAPPASEGAFRWRLVKRLVGVRGGAGPVRCELTISEAVVSAMALALSRGQRLLAAWRVHDALPLRQLLADWGSSLEFAPGGPFGLDDASSRLFGKPATSLDWNEASTLALASETYDEVETCRYPPKLLSLRDPLLEQLARDYPAEAQVILAAKKEKLPCARPTPPSFAPRTNGE